MSRDGSGTSPVRSPGDHELGANPFAAMPSDHLASAETVAIVLSEEDELAGLALELDRTRCREPLERRTNTGARPRSATLKSAT